MSSHFQHHRGRSSSPHRTTSSDYYAPDAEDDSFLNTRPLEAFGRTVQATASHLMGPAGDASDAYRNALSTMHRSLQRPAVQRSVFSLARANPREFLRASFDPSEIEHRAVSYVPDELLRHVPITKSPFSLLDGFRASLPEEGEAAGESLAERIGRRRRRKLLEEREQGSSGLRKEKDRLDHRLEMMGVRKTMCASEIKEIDDKIANLTTMRRIVLDRLAGLEQEEHDLEQEIADVVNRIDLLQEEEEEEAEAEARALAAKSASVKETSEPADRVEEGDLDAASATGFMSESIYQKLPDVKSPTSMRTPKRRKGVTRRVSMPVLHEHMEPGSRIRQVQAHNDTITALDFDAPFGTMVTAALDDTVRVWDLNAGRCMGFLEGHLSSVRCLQVEDNLVATGSMDASIRLWDLSQADYSPPPNMDEQSDERNGDDVVSSRSKSVGSSEVDNHLTPPVSPTMPSINAMADCPLFTLQAHVAEVTALHMRGTTLVSGSADKTLRQWDLEKGRCVQTLDVLWAAAQASVTLNTGPAASATGTAPSLTRSESSNSGWWRPTTSRLPAAEAEFVGALQVFDAALACGTADGMVRLWDLRSGMVHRSLVGHTGPVTALQFDDVFLVTASQDRSIRIWDLRTGTIHDAFAFDNPITSMQFDARRIVAAAGEPVVKVYDKADGRHWDCGGPSANSSTTAGGDGDGDGDGDESIPTTGIVERVKIKDGYMIEGRRDGVVGVWSC